MKKLKFGMANIEVASIDDVSFMKTYRPRDMRLNVTKFEQKLDISLPTLEAEINMVIGDYDEKT
jgi:dTDP-4-dehydrorhamnose reductase